MNDSLPYKKAMGGWPWMGWAVPGKVTKLGLQITVDHVYSRNDIVVHRHKLKQTILCKMVNGNNGNGSLAPLRIIWSICLSVSCLLHRRIAPFLYIRHDFSKESFQFQQSDGTF